jgi:hypothetical protein
LYETQRRVCARQPFASEGLQIRPRWNPPARPVLLGRTNDLGASAGTQRWWEQRPSFTGIGRSRIGARDVTIDFTSFGASIAGGNVFEPDFYRSDGIRFPPQRCGSAGCDTWLIWHIVQGDDALWGETRFGPIKATFTRPISNLSLRVAPTLQGTATYVLSAFAASGKLLATTSVTVTQDFGDPANTGFGYFRVSLTNLPKPAKSFTLDQVFVRSSFPQTTDIPYGVSSISYTHWGQQP